MLLRRYKYTVAKGAHKIKTKTAIVLSSVGLLMGGGSGLAIATFSTAHADTGTVVVTPGDTQGWATQDGAPTYVSGPAGADGVGSLKFVTDNTSTSKENYFHATSTPLSGVNGLGYMVDVDSGVPASYQLQVTGVDRLDSTTSTFTSLVWEPVYNGQVNGPNGGFVTESNLENGVWWSTHPIAGDPAGNNGFVSLSQIIAANPNATVTAFGVNVGSGTPNATSYVDDVAFNGTTYNFEPYVVATDKDACKNDGWKTLTASDGSSFKNQGACVSYVASNGKSQH
jgi:hypothetical protein